MLEWVDGRILAAVRFVAHRFQRLTGYTSYWLASHVVAWCGLGFAVAALDNVAGSPFTGRPALPPVLYWTVIIPIAALTPAPATRSGCARHGPPPAASRTTT